MRLKIASVALSIGAVACIGTTEPPETGIWEGSFVPAAETEPFLAGIAVVTGAQGTQIGISIEDGPPGARFSWGVRNGTCTTSGSLIGPASSFQPIELEDDGSIVFTMTLHRRIDVLGTYAAELFETENRSGPPAACAELIRTG